MQPRSNRPTTFTTEYQPATDLPYIKTSQTMKRVLVTGASGFIGYQCILPLVDRGYEVHAVSRSLTSFDDESVTWHAADLRDSERTRRLLEDIRPTHLLHTAWYLEPGSFYESPENCEWVRISLELVQEFNKRGGKRCVMVGTGFEYDLMNGYCTEHLTPCEPGTIYGRSKYAMQQLLSAYSEAAHLSSAWARVFFLYGPRERSARLVASVITSLLREEPAACSSGEQIRDYLHVADAAGAIVCLLDGDTEGVVNVGSGQPVTIRRIVETIGELIGRPDLIRLGEFDDRPNTPPMAVANISRLNNVVGWRHRYDLRSGLQDTIEWWRKQENTETNDTL